MRLTSLPRLSLAQLPTPLDDVPRLTQQLNGPRILFKRDDLTGMGLGGNKVRKLEFLLADALQQRADVIVTGAGPQSNHLRLTAAAARKCGLDVVLVMFGNRPRETQGNFLLDELLGAEIIFTNDADRSSVDRALQEVAEDLRRRGRCPYIIPRGGATPLGSVGYVECVQELETQRVAQRVQVDHLVCAVGSCGTLAGLWLGACCFNAPYQLWGISVSRPRGECLARVQQLATDAAQILDVKPPRASMLPILRNEYLGTGYGIVTPEAVDAIRLVARTEGIFLDPVYTGKAMAGLMDLIRRGEIGKDEMVVFLHTGGAPSLFAHASVLLP